MSERLFSDLGAKAAKDPIQAERERMNGGSYNDAADIYLRQEQRKKAVAEALKQKMAPPEEFNLPPHLEKRRQQHLIPNGVFRIEPLYEWCYVYQTARYDMEDNEKWGDTNIYKTQGQQKAAENESPRGILCAAGLGALDTLSSHGIMLGDIVFMIRNAPWAIQVDVIGADRLYMHVLRDSDFIGGEDLKQRIRSGELIAKSKVNADGQRIHYYETKDGKPLNPVTPHIPDDL